MDLVFNIAKGRIAHLATLPATNDSLVAIPVESAGLVADALMADYTNVSDLFAGPSNPQVFMGRKTLTSVMVNRDYINNYVTVTAANPTWLAATGNAVGALVIAYNPDFTINDDTTLIPLVKLDWSVTPAGTDITANFPNGIFWLSE